MGRWGGAYYQYHRGEFQRVARMGVAKAGVATGVGFPSSQRQKCSTGDLFLPISKMFHDRFLSLGFLGDVLVLCGVVNNSFRFF